MDNQGVLHIGRKLRMQSGSLVQEVEVVALCEQYVEVVFIEDGERRYIRFAEDGSQVGCRCCQRNIEKPDPGF